MQAASPSPSGATPFRLGIDFGTSHTTAILRWPDGHARPLLFDGSPLLPSAVYAEPGGRLLVGRDAIHAARLDPARFEPTPKRRVAESGDETTIRLGDQEVGITAMVAAVLARVRDEAVRVSGVAAADLKVTVTHPAAWGPERTRTLTGACRLAELPEPRLVPEPVAAAGYFSAVLGRSIPPGSALVVYDFGGGTFDASVVSPAEDGYVVLAVDGLPDVGGVDLDAALFRHVADAHREADPDAWRRLEEPQTPADRRHRRHLIEDIRTAKEMLSRADSAAVPLPLLEQEARITRAEFEALARPMLERTVQTTVGVVAAANLQPGGVAAVLLVGGSSRIPLVADLLRSSTDLEPATIDQPETVVAEGSVRLATGSSGETRAGSSVPRPAQPEAGKPDLGQPADPWATAQRAPATDERRTAEANAGPTPTLVAPVVPAQAPAPAPSAFAAGVASPYPQRPAAPAYVEPAYPGPSYPTQASYPTQVAPYPPQGYTGYPGTAYPSKRRRRWPLVALLMVLMLVAGAAAVVIFVPPERLPSWAQLFDTTSTSPSGSASPTPRQRPDASTWLPADFQSFVDDEARSAIVAGPATNGGFCTYVKAGVVSVKRSSGGVTGCTGDPQVKAVSVSEAAVEAQFRVTLGCGGMWLRTGTQGYFVAVCADGKVSLYRLGETDPDDSSNRLAGPWMDFDPKDVVVGLLAQGPQLKVFINGQLQATAFDDSIASGRVGIGGWAPDGRGLEATITQFRAWRLP